MNVGIYVTGQDEFPAAIDPAGSDRNTGLSATGDTFDFVAVNDEDRVLDNAAVRGVDDGSANERDFFGARAERDKGRDYKDGNSFHKASLSAADSERTMRSASRS